MLVQAASSHSPSQAHACRRSGSFTSADFACVDHLSATLLADVADEALLLQVPDCHTRQRAVDLQTLAHNGWGDELGFRDLFHQLVVCGFVEHHQIGQLLLDFALAPLLFLRTASSHGRFHFCLLGLLDYLVCAHGSRNYSTY